MGSPSDAVPTRHSPRAYYSGEKPQVGDVVRLAGFYVGVEWTVTHIQASGHTMSLQSQRGRTKQWVPVPLYALIRRADS